MKAGMAHNLDAEDDVQMNGHEFMNVGNIKFAGSDCSPFLYPFCRFGKISYPGLELGYGDSLNTVSAFTDVTSSQVWHSYYGVTAASFPTIDRFELKLLVEAAKENYYTTSPKNSPEGLLPMTGHEASIYIGGHEHPSWMMYDPSYHPYEPGGITVYANGDARLDGSWQTAAIIENNLQSPIELTADRIDRFSQGDVLCWKGNRLELCAQAGDPLVQAVADKNGKPIVLGAEPIKVLGPVKEGDLLVASEIPGYAMVDNDPRPGAAIAQALEDFDGEQGVIKAMIRKF
jgi:hypothetical protein